MESTGLMQFFDGDFAVWFYGLGVVLLVLVGYVVFRIWTGSIRARTIRLQAEIIELRAAPRLLSVVRDTTARKQAEEALRASEDKFAKAFRASPDAVTINSLQEGYLLDVNDGFERLTGYRAEEAVGCTARELGLWVDPEDPVRIMETLQEQGTVRDVESNFRIKSGAVRTCLVSAGVIDVGGQACAVAVVRDITAWKQTEAEREQLIEELEAKNAELERFTYTVSHDLKSPLVTIKGFLGLLERDAARGDADQMKRDMAQIGNAADKMQRLLGEVLELSRIGRLTNSPEKVDLAELVCEAASLVAGQIEERNVTVEIDPEMPVAYGDKVRLLEVYQNLLDNAVKFMGDQPDPRIEIGARQEDGEVLCFVRDNGIGIDPEYHELVFGLFDRLDAYSEGTGIGLALVKRIVEVHGGRIWVESEGDGHGCTFSFTLPSKKA